MKNRIIAVIASLVLFVIIVVFVLVNSLNHENEPDKYIDRATATLPIVTFRCLSIKSNPLIGYSSIDDSVAMANTVLPNNEDYVEVSFTNSDNIEKVTVLLQTEDRSRFLDEAETELFKKGGNYGCNYQISVMANKGEKYYLTVKVETKDGKTAFYTTKLFITDDEDIVGKQELLSLSDKFSNATLNKQTDVLTPYIKYDAAKAGTDLSYVNLSTPANFITWAGLTPRSGEKCLEIYEWGKTQISIAYCYRVTSVYEDEKNEYDVKECFTLRERDGKLFVLDYQRYASQVFDGRNGQIGYTSILLGVQDADRMESMTGEDKSDIYFTVEGGVWHYNSSKHLMTDIYGGTVDLEYGDKYPYEVKLLDIVDSKLYFTVIGYIPAGEREGEMGYVLYEYDPETTTTRVKVDLELNAELCKDKPVAHLTADRLFTVEVGGKLYSVDLTGTDVLCVAEDIDVQHMFADSEDKHLSWQKKADSKTIYMMNLDTSSIETITSDSDLELFGYIKQDMVYGNLSKDIWTYYGFELGKLYESLHIISDDGKEKAYYEYDKGRLGDININSSNVTMALLEKTGDEWTISKHDTLIMAVEPDKKESLIMMTSSEIKRDYYYITIPAVQNRETDYAMREALFAESKAAELKAGTDTLGHKYEAWNYGDVVSVGWDINTEVNKIYDSFGVIKDYEGRVLWNRDARDLYLTMNLPKMSWTEEGHEDEMAAMSSLERGVDIFVYSGVMNNLIERDKAESDERSQAVSVYDELRSVFGDRLIVLGRCDISMLLYYINLRHPVLTLTKTGETYLLTGYTSTKLTYYNPADRSTSSMTFEEASELFETKEAYCVCYD